MTDKNIDRIVNETVARLVNEENGFLKGLRRTGSAISDLSGFSNRFREFEKNHPKTTDFMQRFFMIKPEADKDADRMRYAMRAIMKFVRQNGQDFTIACKRFIYSIKKAMWGTNASTRNSKYTVLGRGRQQQQAQAQQQQAKAQPQAQAQQQQQARQAQYPQYNTTSTAQYYQQQPLQEQQQTPQGSVVCVQFYNECVNLVNACYKFLMKWGSDDGISEDDMLTSMPSMYNRPMNTERQNVRNKLDVISGTDGDGNNLRLWQEIDAAYDNFEASAQECYGLIQSNFSHRSNMSGGMIADAVSEFANDFNNIEQLYTRLIYEWYHNNSSPKAASNSVF